MKIIITGSSGHISSNPEKQAEISALGAIPSIGLLEDVDFLASTFAGADAVYTMVPPNNYFDHNLDLPAYQLFKWVA